GACTRWTWNLLSAPRAGAANQAGSRDFEDTPIRPARTRRSGRRASGGRSLQVLLLLTRAAAAVRRGELGRDHVAALVVHGLVEPVGAVDFALRLVAASRQHEGEQPERQPPSPGPHEEPSPPENGRHDPGQPTGSGTRASVPAEHPGRTYTP